MRNGHIAGRRRTKAASVLGAAAIALTAVASFGAQAAVAPPAQAADAYVAPTYGDVVLASWGKNTVFHFDHFTPNGGVGGLPPVIQTVGTGLFHPSSAAVTRTGHVFIADTGNARVLDVAPDGTQTAVGSGWVSPRSVAVDGAGNAYVADTGNKRVYKISTLGRQTLVAHGDGNPNDGFDIPWEVAADSAGNVYIVGRRTGDGVNLILKVTPGGTKTILFQNTVFLDGVAVDRAGNVYFTEAQQRVKEIPADGSSVVTVFTRPDGTTPVVHLAKSADGNLLSSDELNGVRLLLLNTTPVASLAWMDSGTAATPMGMGIAEWVPPFPASPPPPPNPIVGASYTYTDGFPTLPADAGFANKIGLQSGDLPPGLNLVVRTGGFALRGTPTASGTYTFTPEVHNAIDQLIGSPITVTVDEPSAPGAPSIGTATPGTGTAKVTWTAPTSTGGRAVTGYVVTPYVGATAKPAKTFTSTATSQTITGLTNGTTYTFTVAAVNAIGTGAASAASNAVTPSGSWFLRNANSAGASIGGFSYGSPGDVPVAGDWDGDGTTTIGVYRPSTGSWYLRNANSGGASIGGFTYGGAGYVPVVGDWDGNGTTTVGFYAPATSKWFLRNSNSGGTSIGSFAFGSPGDVPVTGDWDGNGTTTIGVYRPSTGQWFLRNANSGGASIGGFTYGGTNATPVVGDWDGNGTTTVGTFQPSTGVWYLRNANSTGASIGGFSYGGAGATPVVGDWDGNATTTIGAYR